MIPHTEPHWQALPWQQELRRAFRQPAALLEFLALDPHSWPLDQAILQDFAMLVPRPFARRMRRGDPLDPLLLQVLPRAAEGIATAGFSGDPLAESASNPRRGLVHKYRNRVLLVTSSGCAVNCRYCFRRHFDYDSNNPSREQWSQALQYIAADTQIEEVILSGGDPLLLSDSYLGDLVAQLERIPHLQRLRIHTRLPVVLPTRVSGGLCQLLSSTRLRSVVVIHCNHPAEIDADVEFSLAQLAASGALLLNQAVLLRDINDNAATLNHLGKALFEAGVLPYYLHLLDRVEGAAHFEVDEKYANSLYQELLAMNSGYLVPRLVREEPGRPSKTPVGSFATGGSSGA
jgi:EF-P beta-lysylation protein EpmB